jgi:nitrilase
MIAAAIQMVSGDELDANLACAAQWVARAAAAGAELVVLPEYFYLMPADEGARVELACAPGEGPIHRALAQMAARHRVWLVGGTLPLLSPQPGRMYNASLLFDPDGRCRARYDKMHLFGFDDGNERYDEAATMMPGDAVAGAATPWGELRLSVCYDLRFPELYRQPPAPALISAPAAFTHTTGLAHWELLLRARAVDNLAFVIGAGQGGRHAGGKRTFGHSMIVDPWGQVLACVEEGEGMALARLDLDQQAQWRRRLPALQHRRLA